MMKRLEALIEWVKGPVIADIGTDHGIVPIEAVKRNRAEKAYACDIAEGPLERAEKAIEQTGMTGRVIPVLCDGIEGVPKDADQFIIAGMGAETIIHILEDGDIGDERLLLSPHSHEELLRRYLSDNGFMIIRERRIADRGHFYPIIDAQRGGQQLTEAEILYGYNVVQDEDWAQFVQSETARLRSLASRVPEKKQEELLKRLCLLQ